MVQYRPPFLVTPHCASPESLHRWICQLLQLPVALHALSLLHNLARLIRNLRAHRVLQHQCASERKSPATLRTKRSHPHKRPQDAQTKQGHRLLLSCSVQQHPILVAQLTKPHVVRLATSSLLEIRVAGLWQFSDLRIPMPLWHLLNQLVRNNGDRRLMERVSKCLGVMVIKVVV